LTELLPTETHMYMSANRFEHVVSLVY